MERLLKKIAHFVFLHHRGIVFVFSLLTVISIITVFKMEIKSDIIHVLPSGNKIVSQFRDFTEKYGMLDKVTVVVESGSNAIDEHIDLIENLSRRLSESPLIEYVDYTPIKVKSDFFMKHFPLFLDERGLKQLKERLSTAGIEQQVRLNYQRLLSPFSSPLDSELIAKDPLNLRGIIMERLKRSGSDSTIDLSAGYYFTKDHSMAFIFVKPKGKSRDMAFVKRFKKEMADIIRLSLLESNNPPDIKIGVTGGHILSEEIRGVIQHDIISSFLLSVFLIGLLILVVYRVRVVTLLIIGFTMLASLAATLAFAYFVFGSLNIVTSIVAAVLIGLYVDYSMHTLKRFGDELQKSNDSLKSLEITLTKTGPAFVVSAITTSLSFFSIIVTRFEGLYELGVVAGMGVLLCLISTLFLMSSLLVWTSKGGFQNLYKGKDASGVETFTNFVVSRPRHIIFMSFFLIVFAGFGIARLGFDSNPEHIGIKGSQSMALGEAVNQRLNKNGEPMAIVVKGKDKEDLAHNFDSLERMLSMWKTDGLIKGYDSPGIFLPPPAVQRQILNSLKEIKDTITANRLENALTSALQKRGMDYDRDYIRTYLDKITNAVTNDRPIGLEEIEDISDPRIRHFYNRDDISIAAYIYPSREEWDRDGLYTLQKDIRLRGRDWTLLGRPVLFNEIKSSILWGSALAIIVTLISNFIILYLAFKKLFYVGLILLPVTVGFLLTIGILGFAGIPFNFINVGTIALIFGFGVDYGIYVMQAYLKEDERDIGNALRITGKNVMMCAATTVAGCGSLVTAKFIGIASIGSVLSIGALSCAFTALIVLPAILYLKRGNGNEGF
ncbi:MAG: MMPL family transporter [Nitrospirae bacterium]|nr:MMPL family transporter [Nitrospirota bacterium]